MAAKSKVATNKNLASKTKGAVKSMKSSKAPGKKSKY